MTNDNDKKESNSVRPTAGNSGPSIKWSEYSKLEQAIDDYLNHEPDDPRYDLWRALAVMLAEYQRDLFIAAYGLSEAAEVACVRRLITGEDECPCGNGVRRGWRERELEAIGGRDDPPHKPPHSDHATLWLDEDGDAAVYSMHIYPGNIQMYRPSKTADPDQHQRNGWFDIFEWAAEWGLEISIHPLSWYNLGSTVQVVFYPPERYR